MFLRTIKNLPPVSWIYKFSGLIWLYHFKLALLGALMYGFPSKKIFVIGVTGTKGKTTTLELINSILEKAGKKTAILSSLRIKVGDDSKKNLSGNTMPGRFFIQKFLKKAVKAGCGYALIEVTSQGVVMSRHKFIKWRVGIITNIAPEHIEAHGSFEKYRDAKLKFLRYVAKRDGKVFINNNDEASDFFYEKLEKYKPVLYSKNDSLVERFASEKPMDSFSKERSSKFFPSEFNKENVAAAVALAKNLGVKDEVIFFALDKFETVPGRTEFINVESRIKNQESRFSVVIDYAHTPDSLKKLYQALSELKAKSYNFSSSSRLSLSETNVLSFRAEGLKPKLICVLGAAGGGRDKWKRPEMGKIAAEYCDYILLTDEDPYDEKPEEILDQIEKGFYEVERRGEFKMREFFRILDRKEAIKKALTFAKEGDIIAVSGKGSESFIHIGHGKKMPWSDKETVLELIK